MKSCEEMEILMNLSLDDMLTSEEQQMLEEHLVVCSACRKRMEELRALKTILGQLEEPVPSELHERILNFVDEQTGNQKKVLPFHKRGWYKALAGVAACAVLAVAAARFVPSMDLSVNGGMQNTSSEQNTAAAPSASPMEETDKAQLAAPQMSYVPEHNIVTAPAMPDVAPEHSMAGATSNDAAENAVTGQMAEDLPPLRQEMVDENNDYQVTTIGKWLKVTGPKEALPDWVDLKFVYQADLEGQSREYVEIAEWAEEYWVDQLMACGFTVEVMEDQLVVENGEHILLVFFWE